MTVATRQSPIRAEAETLIRIVSDAVDSTNCIEYLQRNAGDVGVAVRWLVDYALQQWTAGATMQTQDAIYFLQVESVLNAAVGGRPDPIGPPPWLDSVRQLLKLLYVIDNG